MQSTIRFAVPDGGSDGNDGELAVYDVRGRRVKVLRDEFVGAGEQAVAWDGRDEAGRPVPPGVYVIRLSFDGQDRAVRALVLP